MLLWRKLVLILGKACELEISLIFSPLDAAYTSYLQEQVKSAE